MNEKRILVAASAGIMASSWLERHLQTLIPKKTLVIEIGINKYLSAALSEIGIISEPWGGTVPPRKFEFLKSIKNADHLLLFWDGRSLTDLLFEARLQGLPTKVIPILVTQVVNKDRDDDFDAYIGRGTMWGNPFQVGTQEGQFEREEAIQRYRTYFEKNILGEESMRKGLLGLRGLRIACHCKPLACHGDVIAEYLNKLDPDLIKIT